MHSADLFNEIDFFVSEFDTIVSEFDSNFNNNFSRSSLKMSNLEIFNIDSGFIALLDLVNDCLDDSVGHVVDVSPTLGRGDAVHEGHLLEPG